MSWGPGDVHKLFPYCYPPWQFCAPEDDVVSPDAPWKGYR